MSIVIIVWIIQIIIACIIISEAIVETCIQIAIGIQEIVNKICMLLLFIVAASRAVVVANQMLMITAKNAYNIQAYRWAGRCRFLFDHNQWCQTISHYFDF